MFFFCLSDSQEGKTTTTFMLDLSEIQIPGVTGTAPNLPSSSLLICCCFFFALTDRSSGKPPFWNDLLGKDCCLGLLFFLIASIKLLERIQVLAVYE